MTSKQDQELKDKARKLHFNSIVVDTHADTISRMVDPTNNTHGIHDDPDRARGHYPIAVSYTHLTLPTTPYV